MVMLVMNAKIMEMTAGAITGYLPGPTAGSSWANVAGQAASYADLDAAFNAALDFFSGTGDE